MKKYNLIETAKGLYQAVYEVITGNFSHETELVERLDDELSEAERDRLTGDVLRDASPWTP